ncbi:MAG: M23 family metallopeptidase [Sporichthyaceae bacterium]
MSAIAAAVADVTDAVTDIDAATLAPTGRRRRPVTEPPAAAVAAPTGRRRKPAEAGTLHASPAVLDAAPRVEAVELAPAPAPVAAGVDVPASRRTGPAHVERHRARNQHLHAPSGTALVAGAAAIAVAAVGAIGASQSGTELGVTGVEMARASALGVGLSQGPSSAPQVTKVVDTSARDAVRASRERAREALADRKREAAEVRKRAVAAARAVSEARERAERLASLAKLFRMPVSGYRLTAHFGESGGYWSAGHTGLDFAAPYGTPIRAVANGVVVFSGWDGSYGYKTVIRHADGTETWYAHQSRMLIRSGQVAAGDIIGRVGSTGNSTGSHLHFEVRVNDIALNPLVWLRARGLNP